MAKRALYPAPLSAFVHARVIPAGEAWEAGNGVGPDSPADGFEAAGGGAVSLVLAGDKDAVSITVEAGQHRDWRVQEIQDGGTVGVTLLWR